MANTVDTTKTIGFENIDSTSEDLVAVEEGERAATLRTSNTMLKKKNNKTATGTTTNRTNTTTTTTTTTPTPAATKVPKRRMSRLATLERIVTNIFLLTIIVLFFIDACPTYDGSGFAFLAEAQTNIDVIMDKTGLWQGQWHLFCPDPLHRRVRISANLLYKDEDTGNTYADTWEPMGGKRWVDMPWWEKRRYFRMEEYVDSVRQNTSRRVWPALAKYLKEHVRKKITVSADQTGNTNPQEHELIARYITLTRHWNEIEDPPERPIDEEDKPHWLLGYPLASSLAPERKYTFYQHV